MSALCPGMSTSFVTPSLLGNPLQDKKSPLLEEEGAVLTDETLVLQLQNGLKFREGFRRGRAFPSLDQADIGLGFPDAGC